MGEDDNNPNQMLHSHLGPSKELAVKRLPMLPRQFSLNSGQGQQADGGAGGRERFWHQHGDTKAFLHRNLNHICSPGNWHLHMFCSEFPSSGNAEESSRLLKKAISWQRLHFRNGCEDFPFETKDKQKRTQTGWNVSPLLDERTERGATFSPHLCLEVMLRGGRVTDAYLTRQLYIFIRRKMDNA